MRGHTAAFTWEITQRYRWGWRALALWLAALAAMRVTVAVTDAPLFDAWGAGYAFAVVCPGTAALYWFIAIFTHGTSGSVAGKQSLFPRRLLTLPVSSDALATWPMVAGGAAVAILWFTTRLLAPWPDDPSPSLRARRVARCAGCALRSRPACSRCSGSCRRWPSNSASERNS